MSAETTAYRMRTPPLVSLRVPADVSPYGLAASAHLMWRLTEQGRDVEGTAPAFSARFCTESSPRCG